MDLAYCIFESTDAFLLAIGPSLGPAAAEF